ncbi:2-oxoglutarate dehydrogenase complex dihydrolipoyllysine-residue succinyltransferase [Bacillus atrophaeus]|jgi:2-oxoglutarate dehydrogenase E2 component (dihydrolipoamide succinyltransferase)|uniref:2-oxoglutarate dehydrogenase complex dihydrolipoyllysine-residue succinyltransferase n=1 Tax=Bacillus atrophaeus TaxID=1452 RepID=UPI002282D0F5|nr:2-oxoglutarate dehydrogenase complex dihydrolipoyllysine-residue succinyltransferase [Bacillus atrophaeus]MCY8958337.1 2-oxoglutarate dehydrogenase complex dihydrolipoyllysine-residue succinyltransferase [Bacillus atrophaeus]MCY8963910.1 2-oxoglutarate dehydrogenase complex dihydrolipoyllysine-residue succinyltransferase [Bacillus atrophaeus]MCY9439566.1 2-oxoglutarate dehydrogenase complex dihydrolipoyllysine-residue succinyltransferase [Bacillus atrophaeus]MEC0648348.1 2-oxoglutarate dehyd
MAEIKVPELAESISEGTIAQWLKQPGDYVEQGEYLLELETDKVNVELTAEESGVLQEVLKDSGDTVQVGEIIGTITEGAGESSAPASEDKAPKSENTKEEKQAEPAAQQVSQEAQEESKSRTVASPSARKLAREKGIDLSQIPTGDPLGRVRKQDVEAYEKPSAKPVPQPKQQPQAQKSQQDFEKPVEVQRMSRRRQTIAKRLVEVQQTSAMLTTFNEVDMTAVMNVRKRRKDQFLEQNEVKLGFMSFFTKAVVAALKKFPLLNAEIQGDELIIKKFYDVGIAVAANEGLVVPVVRDADRLSFAGIEREIGELAKKARSNKLTLGELQGGSFTITNGGTFGSLLSTPILNSPQVGILGMHKIQLRPVAIDEERFENRPMMYIALSYDHRIVDGKEAVGFLVTVKNLLEDPEQLLLEG